jgi:hypothetical protein
VAAGEAVGEAQLVQERPVEGVQLYTLAPLAVSVALLPAQMLSGPATLILGVGFTNTVTLEVSTQPVAEVPVT